jgi:hypothetical protein
MSLIKKPIFWIGVAAVGVVGWMATAPEETGSSLATTRVTKKKAPSKKTTVAYVEEDYNATFEPVNIELKNSFQPIIARKGAGLGVGEGQANSIPAEFAGGDSGWFFTGNAEIDGVPTALLENRSTGEGVFLKAGERWKSAMVSQIMPDSVVMKGPSGTKTFSLVNEERPKMTGGFAPLPVAVSPEIRNQGRQNQNRNAETGNQRFGVMPGPGAGVVTIPSGNDNSEFFFAPGE